MQTIHSNTRSTFDKYLPLMLGLLAAWMTGRALKKMFWTAVSMFWVVRAMGIHW